MQQLINGISWQSFCKAKDTVTKTKWQPTEWENTFTNTTSDRGQIFKIYKELKKFEIKLLNNPIKKWDTDLNRILNRRIANGWKTLKELLNIFSHQRNAWDTMLYWTEWLRSKMPMIAFAVEDMESGEHFSIACGNENLYNQFGNQCDSFSENWESVYLKIYQYHSWAYPKDAHFYHKVFCLAMFIAALFIIARNWK